MTVSLITDYGNKSILVLQTACQQTIPRIPGANVGHPPVHAQIQEVHIPMQSLLCLITATHAAKYYHSIGRPLNGQALHYNNMIAIFEIECKSYDNLKEEGSDMKVPLEGKHWNKQEELQDFIDRCKLDIFLAVCKVDSVGDDNASPESYVREVCDIIRKLRQTYMQDGKLVTDSPDDVYQKFMQLIANLPDDVKEWPIFSPTTYLSALSEKIRSQIIKDKKFKMPKISKLLRKIDQIKGMRIVKNQAMEIFDDITVGLNQGRVLE